MEKVFKIKSFLSMPNMIISWFGVLTLGLASLVIFINNFRELEQGYFYFSSFIFLLIFLVAITSPKKIAPIVFIFLTPLLPALNLRFTVFGGVSWASLPMAGCDLVAGYFLAILVRSLIKSIVSRNIDSLRELRVPWPINIVMIVISFSTILAILRNVWASASPISMSAVPLSLIGFRSINWFDDLRPLTDWMAYALATGTFLLTFYFLNSTSNRLALIFRPLMAGLLISGILAIIQSRVGMGFEQLPAYRDILGYAPFGFEPDLHAFAGYTLLGAVGLWGYYSTVKNKYEILFIFLVIVISWYALMASMSKASIIFAVLVTIASLFSFLIKWRKTNSFSILHKWIFLALVTLVFLSIAYLMNSLGVPHWLKYTHAIFRDINWLNFNEISLAFSGRPGIWLVALRMWFSFPIFGVGQGNFYQLSSIFNFDNIPDLISGENAHNYFLQTLSEVGLTGALVFSFALSIPFILAGNRRQLLAGSIGLFSLFLGNIFAHSFLVRENLFLAAILLGLMYSSIPEERLNLNPCKLLKTWRPGLPWKLILIVIFCTFFILGFREIYSSLYSFPFKYGAKCFLSKPLTPDKWTTGLYEIPLPEGSHVIQLSINVIRPNLQKFPVSGVFQVLDSENQVLTTRTYEWSEIGMQEVEIILPGNISIQESGARLRLGLSSCYVPRNLGNSNDGRRLGVIVDSYIIN